MVPDISPRASKGVFALAFVPVGARERTRRVLAPEASEEWFHSFEVLLPHVVLRLVWSFPHASWL
jgi:hypothetical protein